MRAGSKVGIAAVGRVQVQARMVVDNKRCLLCVGCVMLCCVLCCVERPGVVVGVGGCSGENDG